MKFFYWNMMLLKYTKNLQKNLKKIETNYVLVL
jgi:hypothetical protein